MPGEHNRCAAVRGHPRNVCRADANRPRLRSNAATAIGKNGKSVPAIRPRPVSVGRRTKPRPPATAATVPALRRARRCLPIPGKDGGNASRQQRSPLKQERQAFDPTPSPPAQGGRIRDTICIQAIRSGLLHRRALRDPAYGVLPRREAIHRPVNTLLRQHSERAAAPLASSSPHPNHAVVLVMSGSVSPPVADNGPLQARRTLARQPLARLFGVAFVAGTRDNNDHSRREGAPWSVPAKAHYSKSPPSLLCIRFQTEKEGQACLRPIGRFISSPDRKIFRPRFQCSAATRPKPPAYPLLPCS